jgi:tetratricopeptide (TPR) repeat protein
VNAQMFNNNEDEEKQIEAIKLIDKAETLADKGNGDEAIKLYEKAAQIYLDLGSYLKLDELFIRIIQIIHQFRNNIQAVYRLKSIIRKTEELKLDEISAKLLIQLGNISYRMNDWETAGESWNKASDYLFATDPEEYLNLGSILLLKAGQAYEKAPHTKDLGKHLILKAVMKINKFDELYQEEEKRALLLLENKDFLSASEKFYKISSYFRKALNNLGELLDEAESKETMLNAKARFIHFVAEYQVISSMCLSITNNPDFKEKIDGLGYDSIELFKQSISLLKEYLIPIKSDFDREIVLRITFDTMLLAIIQRILDTEKLSPKNFLLEGMEKNKALLKNIKKSPYLAVTDKIDKIGLIEALQDLLNVNLGHFERIKNILISSILNNES